MLKVAKKAGGLAFTAFTGVPTPDQIQTILGTIEGMLSDPTQLATKENAEKALGEVKNLLKEKAADSTNVPEELSAFRKRSSSRHAVGGETGSPLSTLGLRLLGARLSEVCQLRREDIVLIDNFWCMRFVPEAGSLKTVNAERTVPLHQALIDEGFLNFVESVCAGPLFSGLRPDKFGRGGGTGTKQLGRWVRSLGITDPRLQPNHSWRHRMRTLGRRHGLAPDIVDAFVGHARRSVADRYGEFEVSALSREISKIPVLSLGEQQHSNLSYTDSC
jgi:integrase